VRSTDGFFHITGVRAASRREYLGILPLHPNREDLLWLGHFRAAWMEEMAKGVVATEVR
jgi:hypothetical protein